MSDTMKWPWPRERSEHDVVWTTAYATTMAGSLSSTIEPSAVAGASAYARLVADVTKASLANQDQDATSVTEALAATLAVEVRKDADEVIEKQLALSSVVVSMLDGHVYLEPRDGVKRCELEQLGWKWIERMRAWRLEVAR